MCARVAISCGFLLIFNFAVNDDFAGYFYTFISGANAKAVAIFALSLCFLLPLVLEICAAGGA